MRRSLLAVLCAIVGALAGYYGFVALMGQGYYALVLPGGLAGLAGGIVPARSKLIPLVCAVLAVVAGLVAEHRFAPFVTDHSFGFFLRHVNDLRPMTLTLIGIGGLIGFWVPFRRRLR